MKWFNRASRLEKLIENDDKLDEFSGLKKKAKKFFSIPFERGFDFFFGYLLYKEVNKGIDEGLSRYTSFFGQFINKQYFANFPTRIETYLYEVHEKGLFNHLMTLDYRPLVPYLNIGVISFSLSYLGYHLSKDWSTDVLLKEVLNVRRKEIEKNYTTVKTKKHVGAMSKGLDATLCYLFGDYRETFDNLIKDQKKEDNNFMINDMLCSLYFEALYTIETAKNKTKERVVNAQSIVDKYGGEEFYSILLKRYVEGWTKDKIKTKRSTTPFREGLVYEIVKNKKRRKRYPKSRLLQLQDLNLRFIANDYEKFFQRFKQLLNYEYNSGVIKALPYLDWINSENKDFYEKTRSEMLEFEIMRHQLPLFTAYAQNIFLTITQDSEVPFEMLEQSVELLYNMRKKLSGEEHKKVIRIENTKNPVYFYPQESELTQILFKESESYKKLRVEFVTALKRKELVKHSEDLAVVNPIIITELYGERKKAYVYITELIQGETIDEVIKNNNEDIGNLIEKVLRYTGIIHSKEFETKLNNRYLGNEVKQKFSGESLSEIVFEIIDSLSVLNNFTEHEKSVVLDLHGANFIAGIDGKLYAIDHERNFVSAVTDDLSRLFHLINARIDYYGNKQKNIEYEHMKDVYLGHIDGRNIFFEPERFDLCFLKSNVRNTFSLYSYFSKREDLYPSLNNYLVGVSINSIEQIKGNFEPEYKKNKEQYDRINEVLLRINHGFTE